MNAAVHLVLRPRGNGECLQKMSLTLIVTTNRQNFGNLERIWSIQNGLIVGSWTDYDTDLINKVYLNNRKLNR